MFRAVGGALNQRLPYFLHCLFVYHSPHSLSYAFTTDGSHVSPLELGDYVSRTVKDRRTLAQAVRRLADRIRELPGAGNVTAWSFLVGVLPLVFSSGVGCESRQAIGLVTFAGMLVSTIVGIAFPPAYIALFSRLRAKSVHG